MMYILIWALLLVIPIASLIAGIGLLLRKDWARKCAIAVFLVLSAFCLLNVVSSIFYQDALDLYQRQQDAELSARGIYYNPQGRVDPVSPSMVGIALQGALIAFVLAALFAGAAYPLWKNDVIKAQFRRSA